MTASRDDLAPPAGTPLLDDADLLRRVARAELNLGCHDTAVFGGFARFCLRLARRLADGAPSPSAAELETLAERMASYRQLPVPAREKLVQGVGPTLDRLVAAVTPPPLLPPERPHPSPGPQGRGSTHAAASTAAGSSAPAAPAGSPTPDSSAPAAPAGSPTPDSSAPAAPSTPAGTLDDPARAVRGVGPRGAELLATLGLTTRRDILHHFPFRYEDRRELVPIRQLRDGTTAAIMATVAKVHVRRPARGRGGLVEVRAEDQTGAVNLVWFGQPYLARLLKPGVLGVFFGRVSDRGSRLQMVGPEFELIHPGEEQETVGRIVPFYRLCRGLSQKRMRRIVAGCAREWSGSMGEPLPLELAARHGFPTLADAVYGIHLPETMADVEKARRRLVFEELFILQVALAIKKHFFADELPGVAVKDGSGLVERLRGILPYRFTAAQERSLADILTDMAAPRSMSRLLQGEVGSGKTVVALAALLAAVGDGHQGVIMAPTEILAEQHYITMGRLLSDLGLQAELLVGRQPKKQRAAALQRIADGSSQVIVGTHAVLGDEVHFHRLGLVVVDEQHRFGVTQRSSLRHKGRNPNLLVMTATPIPRTLCMTLYGDLDVSVLDEMPPGRTPVTTRWLAEADTERAWAHLDAEVEAGRQGFVVCPRIEKSDRAADEDESEHAEARAATAIHRRLAEGRFAGRRVLLLHGRMPTAEKDDVMEAMRRGECDVLVATTVVEVGIDIPNATVMVILGAEHFGLAQLHQLRGRVGRSSHPSSCWLVGDPGTDEAHRRLDVMTRTTDGFVVAEEDLSLRGPGDFFGTRQSGLPDLRIADLVRDGAVLTEARQEAFALVARDPDLALPEHAGLADELRRRFLHLVYFRS